MPNNGKYIFFLTILRKFTTSKKFRIWETLNLSTYADSITVAMKRKKLMGDFFGEEEGGLNFFLLQGVQKINC